MTQTGRRVMRTMLYWRFRRANQSENRAEEKSAETVEIASKPRTRRTASVSSSAAGQRESERPMTAAR